MSALAMHFLAGLLVGVRFRSQTILVLALAVVGEGAVSIVLEGAYTGFLWLLATQCSIQLGYLSGIYLRSVLERAGVVVHWGERSSEGHIRDVRPG
jgi:hypothetical protein